MISQILCVYRQEAYKFFDKFNLVDIVSKIIHLFKSLIVLELPQADGKEKLFLSGWT